MVLNLVSKAFTSVFGTRNARLVKAYRGRVLQINDFEAQTRQLTDAQLRDRTEQFRQRVRDGESVKSLLPEAMAVAREVMDRAVGLRNIFNPESNFDPTVLPADMQALYEKIKAQADALEPVTHLGCRQHPQFHHQWDPIPGWMQVEIPNALYDAVRAVYDKSRPPFRARPFDVQLIGGMVLSEGKIAEMKTGEGKTIVAPLACYLACLDNLQCHVITVNDYLVQRDRDWVFPFYHWLGLTVGAIHPQHVQPHELKSEAYTCDVVYGTNSEFGFDYLRDNMKLSTREQVQKKRDFAIIDEVDSILIDEARTPLIISGSANDDAPRYGLADQVARHLMQVQRDWDQADARVQSTIMRIKGLEGDIRNARDKARIPAMREEMKKLNDQIPQLEADRDQYVQYYEVEMDKKQAHLTHQGVAEAQKVAGIGSFYVGNNMDFAHLLENALRAHAVYRRDKDYVVQNGEVVIVDENTGRLMVGRQWSDGLHQAVESKERVRIKEETQTLATVTIQNFFKLYKRLAGMTGTADTEATEFNQIYKLEVVCIPTNVPVIRHDYDDLIFLAEKDKWDAIVDEIKRLHDVGLPVLVGTTSVERSEMLSERLRKRHGIQHEVLNAKQHEREANIVLDAGKLGAVMIATNMAGRGTDIKLQRIEREELIQHWQNRHILPRQAKASMSNEELLTLAWRFLAQQQLGLKERDLNDAGDDAIRLQLLRHWVAHNTYVADDKAAQFDEEQCKAELDKLHNFLLHRLELWTHVEELGGLQIIGTERHESRRIDNQLRGRAGRQGDDGASRFFISLEDDLMKLFANKTVLSALSKLGMKEGDAIEHRWITKSVERAQRKVEERNYQIRKNLLEWDEVPEQQRRGFYSVRQEVLEGRNIEDIIFDYIGSAIDDACDHYLARDYTAQQISQWLVNTMDYAVEAERLTDRDLMDLKAIIKRMAKEDLQATVEAVLGEYMPSDTDESEWDLKSLGRWAQSKYQVHLSQTQLRQMSAVEVRRRVIEAAEEQIDARDAELDGIAKFLEEHYPQKQLADWARNQFGVELVPAELAKMTSEQVADHIIERARGAYHRREIEYPVDFVLDLAFSAAREDGQQAAAYLAEWVNNRFDMGWDADKVLTLQREELRNQLVAAQEAWLDGKLEQLATDTARKVHEPEALAKFVRERFGEEAEAADFEGLNTEAREQLLVEKGRFMLRAELTQLERFVLLQILDAAWKDHLSKMDQLRDAVGLRAYAEQDPRIVYKREGSQAFAEMQRVVRDRVTNLIFRARLTANVEARNVYHEKSAQHAEATSALAGGGAAPAASGGEQPGGEGSDAEVLQSRKQRRAAAARERKGGPAGRRGGRGSRGR